jgi:hypothetical protein
MEFTHSSEKNPIIVPPSYKALPSLQATEAQSELSEGRVKVMVMSDNKPRQLCPTGGLPAVGLPAGGHPACGRPACGRPAGGRPAGGRPAGGRPVGGRPVGGRHAGGRPEGGHPAGRRATSTCRGVRRGAFKGAVRRGTTRVTF